MYLLYKIFLFLLIIISPFLVIIRIIIGKEDPIRFREKFCFFSNKSLNGKTVWIHGASLGEIQSIIPIIKKFEKNNKIKQILITSNTLSSSVLIQKFKFKKTVHQFFPIDLNYFSKKFLNYWNPSIAIFVDSEIWPNMILNLYKKEIPIIILNARFTKKSFKRWISFPNFSKNIFKKISMAIPQNSETLFHLKALGVKNIKKISNIKYYGEKFQSKINTSIKKKFLNRNIWCAASTHEGEEIIIANIHKKLKSNNKKLLTILIPRHVNRKNSIIRNLKDNDLKIITHSSGDRINNNTDIYLVDSYGEVLNFYNLTKLVFMGGSLVPHGGQNPLEPARLGNTIIHGPYVGNFKEVYSFLKKLKLSIKINKPSQIEKILIKNIKHSPKNTKTKKLNLIGKKILADNINELNKYI